MTRTFFTILFIVCMVATFILPLAAWCAIFGAAFSIGMTHFGLAGGVLLAALGGWVGIAPCLWLFMICVIWTQLFAALADA